MSAATAADRLTAALQRRGVAQADAGERHFVECDTADLLAVCEGLAVSDITPDDSHVAALINSLSDRFVGVKVVVPIASVFRLLELAATT